VAEALATELVGAGETVAVATRRPGPAPPTPRTYIDGSPDAAYLHRGERGRIGPLARWRRVAARSAVRARSGA